MALPNVTSIETRSLGFDIANNDTLSVLYDQFCSPLGVKLEEVLTSIFCATLCRITGYGDGTFMLQIAPMSVASPICFNLSPEENMYVALDHILYG